MGQNEAELRISRAATERIETWVKRELRSHARHGLIAAGVFVLLALLANTAVYFVLVVTSFKWVFHNVGLGGMTISALAALGLLAAMYPTYFIWRRPAISRTALASGVVKLPVQKHEASALVPTGDTNELSTERWQADFVLFPAWLAHMAVQHVVAPWQAWRADASMVARVLIALLIEHRRMDLHELEAGLPGEPVAAAVNVVRHIDGVLFWHRSDVSVSMNTDLRRTLAAMI
jgi:hypothetical protein